VVSRRGTANSGRAKVSRAGGQSHEVPRPVWPVREEGSGGASELRYESEGEHALGHEA